MTHLPTTKPHKEYVREVKNLLPKEAFLRNPKKLLYLLSYFLILIGACISFRLSNSVIFYLILSCVLSHCLSSIGFLSHELSHGTIIKSKKRRYLLEVISWGINLIPATLWDRIHNHSHHTQTNTIYDPDRQYFVSEKTVATRIYTKIFYPNAKFIRGNPLVAIHFIPYILRNIISVFYSGTSKPAVVPFKPKYNKKQKASILFELVIIAMLQMVIFYLTGSNVVVYIFAGPISYLFTSSILMTYIFTNHFLNPVTEHSDPLLGTTTVEVPPIFNKLHFNFSYHTEHHLFPSLNSKFYPELSGILKKKYPERYNYLTMTNAWKKLWKNHDFISSKDKT